MTPPAERQDPETGGLTVAEAAARLGVTPDAVRRRLHRGTLAGDKTNDGQWRVRLSEQAPGPAPGERQDTARTPPASEEPVARTSLATEMVASYEARLSEMGADLAFLRSELEARTEEIRRRDHIIAGLVERVTALPATIDVADVPPDAKRATRRDDRGEEVSAVSSAPQESVLRRWWRRISGG